MMACLTIEREREKDLWLWVLLIDVVDEFLVGTVGKHSSYRSSVLPPCLSVFFSPCVAYWFLLLSICVAHGFTSYHLGARCVHVSLRATYGWSRRCFENNACARSMNTHSSVLPPFHFAGW